MPWVWGPTARALRASPEAPRPSLASAEEFLLDLFFLSF